MNQNCPRCNRILQKIEYPFYEPYNDKSVSKKTTEYEIYYRCWCGYMKYIGRRLNLDYLKENI